MPMRTRTCCSSGQSAAASLVCVGGSRDRSLGTREGNEERVTFTLELVATVPVERLPQQRAVQLQSIGVPFAPEQLQQPRRPLDVGEQHRHGPLRLLSNCKRDDCALLAPGQARARQFTARGNLVERLFPRESEGAAV
jgi:hypothetical protein